MRYLSSEPFTLAVSGPNQNRNTLDDLLTRDAQERARQQKAKKPHEYIDVGGMCIICCLAREAEIHLRSEGK